MKNFSIAALILLSSCSAVEKNEDNLKKIAHDAVDEVIDDAVAKKQSSKEKK